MSASSLRMALPATLKHPQIMPWLEGVALQPGQTHQLDASALQAFDSSALAGLMELRRRAQAVGAQLDVVGLPDRVRGLAQVYGVLDLI
jgi:phospholipid transport system transporter-binding protein